MGIAKTCQESKFVNFFLKRLHKIGLTLLPLVNNPRANSTKHFTAVIYTVNQSLPPCLNAGKAGANPL
jgi:hypothetical protein